MYIGTKLPVEPLDMRKFDPTHLARMANDLLGRIDSPRRRQILINFRDHALAEALGDHTALMETCSRKSQRYEVFGTGADIAAKMMPDSYEALWHHYKALIDLRMYLIHTEPEKLIVGEDCVAIEGNVHQLMTGQTAQSFFGVTGLSPDAVYQNTARICVIFIFDDEGKGAGEHSYSHGGISHDTLTLVPPELVPAQFYAPPGKVSDFFAANPALDWPRE